MSKILTAALLFLSLQFAAGTAFAYSQNTDYTFTVKRGDSLSKYFSQLGLSSHLLANLLSASPVNKRLNRLNIGEKITLHLHPNKRFKSLNYQALNQDTLEIRLVGKRFSNTLKTSKKKSGALSATQVIIKRSFGFDAQQAGLSLSTINAVVQAFSWQLDFNKNLRKGDYFTIIHEKGEKNPVGIFYKSGQKRLEAFAYKDNYGHSKYYDRYGYTLNSSFLKAPLKYKRISSKFQLKRYHPTLKTYRPHRAIDYAAPAGTPVYSAADGIIKLKGWKGALGKAVIIQHGANYTTVYAHLSKWASRLYRGKVVKKGQIIGYVGSTGRSTGAHLHYELRFKGKRKNPLTHKLPKQQHVDSAQRWDFLAQVNKILAAL
jgi:murein DD-endopeptidase MepM/ murein hydrolase activator NlpD